MIASRLRRAGAGLLFLAALLPAACVETDEVLDLHRRNDEFAVRFIEDFHAGGLERVRARVKPATLRRKDAGAGFAAMRRLPPDSTPRSIRPTGGQIDKGRVTVARLIYRVHGDDRSADVELWIETSRKGRLVENPPRHRGSPERAPGPRS